MSAGLGHALVHRPPKDLRRTKDQSLQVPGLPSHTEDNSSSPRYLRQGCDLTQHRKPTQALGKGLLKTHSPRALGFITLITPGHSGTCHPLPQPHLLFSPLLPTHPARLSSDPSTSASSSSPISSSSISSSILPSSDWQSIYYTIEW